MQTLQLSQEAVFLESASVEASADVEEGGQASSDYGLHLLQLSTGRHQTLCQ